MTRKTSKTNYYEKLNCCFCLLFLYTEYIYILNTYLLVRRKTVCFVAPRPPLVYTKCRTTKKSKLSFFYLDAQAAPKEDLAFYLQFSS